jgi:dual specificity tyrosine-phosphorylation-regulated kinase 2/3/4
MSPAQALRQHFGILTEYEQAEILDYPEIYFVGPSCKKFRPALDKTQNYGFDDDRSDYNLNFHDHVAYRFELLSMLGKGSFGQVALAFDHKTKEQVALKIIRNRSRFH